MSAPALLLPEKLTSVLRALCAQPSSAGQIDDLRATAALLTELLHGLGMVVHTLSSAGAPLLLAHRAGRSPRKLLLYHRYDAPPPGPWRAWSHEPFQLAEREGALYGRGVSDGKGALAVHILALQALIEAEDELPCGVTIVVEGEGLSGSPHLAAAMATRPDLLRADACLASRGERDAAGVPLCYNGSKGLLQVRLSARGPAYPLPAGMASTLPNPLWRIIWALAHIKGDDEDIRIPGFYEGVDGPTREENILLRQLTLDEAGRLAAWQTPAFLFGMAGVPLVRAEVTLPTCNLSALSCEPGGELALLPACASAVLDFQLMPQQEPTVIFELLRAHLAEHGFEDIALEALPGGYPPARTPPDTPFLHQLVSAGEALYGAPMRTMAAGPFALPLRLLADASGAPVASLGLARSDSAPFGPDEHIAAADLIQHGQLLIELLGRMR